MRRLTSFRLILLLLVVALLAGIIYLGVGYYRDYQRQGVLAQDIAAVDSQISALRQMYDIEALEAVLASLEQQLAEAHFPMDVEDNTIYDYVRTAAEEAGVRIDSWVEEDVTEEEVNGSYTEYRLFSYEVDVTGTLTAIFDFLSELEANAPYDTIKMDDVDLAYDSTTGDWTITFDMLVFAQPE